MGFRSNAAARRAAALCLCRGRRRRPSAASFDCGKARTADEKAICASPALSDLDTQMATLYGVRMQIPMLMGARGAAQDEQRAWLASAPRLRRRRRLPDRRATSSGSPN